MEALAAAVKAGNRKALSKALTLTESTRGEHQALALELLNLLQNGQVSDGGFRIGITGPPGAGKSSIIETLGCSLVERGTKVACLAVDPSSESSGGSILGDKTRMAKLSCLDAAYCRPSPSRGTLGGVARSTFETMAVCTAAGYSTVLVETVGVGQSEIAVADLVDCMLLILSPVGGDELQSIKRGITELADIIVVNKADGALRLTAARAAASFRATTHLRPPRKRSWSPLVLPVSAHTGAGMEGLQQAIEDYLAAMRASGELAELRAQQRAKVTWAAAQEELLARFRTSAGVKLQFANLEPEIRAGVLGPRSAALQLLNAFGQSEKSGGKLQPQTRHAAHHALPN